jgi:hypothetical protein
VGDRGREREEREGEKEREREERGTSKQFTAVNLRRIKWFQIKQGREIETEWGQLFFVIFLVD